MMKDLFKTVNSEWVAPSEYPDLSTHDKVAIDLHYYLLQLPMP